MKKTSNKGFTLVELIIVIAILAIIMLIAIPNFSGIQQRMQVRADKATAAQIGKAVRIWYTEYSSDPAFKATVDGKLTEDKKLPTPGNKMLELAELPEISGYVDSSLAPTSLRTSTGSSDTAQKYWIGFTGTGTNEKVIVSIANAVPQIPEDEATGESSLDAKSDVQYDGLVNTASEEKNAKFKKSLAYMEP